MTNCLKDMNQQNIFNKMLVDFMLLHGYLLDNPGLMTGKAGIMLSLYEVSQIDKREIIKETAFELLKSISLEYKKNIHLKKEKQELHVHYCILLRIILLIAILMSCMALNYKKSSAI